MNIIKRERDVITNNEDLKHLHTFKDFPVFMGTTDQPIENDLNVDMSWYISEKSGMIQLNPVLPLEIVYMSDHGSGTVGNSWEKHHKAFANFINKFDVNNVLEIGGLHGILSEKFNKINDSVDWTIIEPNPISKKDIKAKVIKGWFNDKFESDVKYDTVIHSHVFEHTYQPNEFIKHISSFLDDGLMIFSVPNMDEMIKKGYTNCINFEHTILLGEYHIEYLLSNNGFEIIDKEYYKDDHSIFYCAKKNINIDKKALSRNVYDYYNSIFNHFINDHLVDVSNLNDSIIKHNGPVYLFGAHIFSQYLISFGLDTSRVINILDNDPTKHDKRLYGTSLITKSPQILKDIDDALVIIRTAFYDNEIKEDIINNINQNVKFI